MNCTQIAELLSRLQPGSDPETLELSAAEQAALRLLGERGLVRTVAPVPSDTGAMGALRGELVGLERTRLDLVAQLDLDSAVDVDDDSLLSQIAAIDGRAQALRTKILEAGEAIARAQEGVTLQDGSKVAVTFRGRALLVDLHPRLDRFGGGDLAAFESEMRWLRDSFGVRATRARTILQAIRTSLPLLPEKELVSAAVGLGGRPLDPEAGARRFIDAYRVLASGALTQQDAVLAAGCLAAGASPIQEACADFQGVLTGPLSTYQISPAERVACAVLVQPLDSLGSAQALLEAVRLGSNQPPGRTIPELSPFVLLAIELAGADPGAAERFWALDAAVRQRAGEGPHAAMAAAIGTLGRVPHEEMLRRFSLAYDYLSRLSAQGMVIPAALLGLLDADVDETLDNLRLASTAVEAERLAHGGTENLLLAVKLLLQTALATAPSAPAEPGYRDAPAEAATGHSLGLLGLAVALPVAASSVSFFHEVTLRELSVLDFHPVHTHYSYGDGGDDYRPRRPGWG